MKNMTQIDIFTMLQCSKLSSSIENFCSYMRLFLMKVLSKLDGKS